MTQKATIGGTPTKAPLGYLNVRTTDAKGREIRDIAVDPDRADLIRFAFTAYATGDWSLSSLAKELNARGLTTRPTPAQPARPITTTTLHKVLTNPYYQGTVTFRGLTYDGAHTPLVDSETWLRVQAQLDAKNAVGERPQKYDHYLKGSLYCSCGAKLMIERPRDKNGDRYEYFTCSGRRRKRTPCTRSAILAERIEQRIEATYNTNGLTNNEAERVQDVLHRVFDQLEATSDDERKLLEAQKDKLEAERLKLVQAHYADAIPLDLLKSEQERIHTSLDQITRRLDTMTATYTSARDGLDEILDLLTDLGDLYNRCEPAERRMLNRPLFDRIIIDEDENISVVPAEPAASVLAHVNTDVPEPVTAETNLPRTQAGQVSIFSTYVELWGFEPQTSSMPWRRATNCAIAPSCTYNGTGSPTLLRTTPAALRASVRTVPPLAPLIVWASGTRPRRGSTPTADGRHRRGPGGAPRQVATRLVGEPASAARSPMPAISRLRGPAPGSGPPTTAAKHATSVPYRLVRSVRSLHDGERAVRTGSTPNAHDTAHTGPDRLIGGVCGDLPARGWATRPVRRDRRRCPGGRSPCPRPRSQRRGGRSWLRHETAPSSDGADRDLLEQRGAMGIRTPDLLHAMEARYQLRHSPEWESVPGLPADSQNNSGIRAIRRNGRCSAVVAEHPLLRQRPRVVLQQPPAAGAHLLQHRPGAVTEGAQDLLVGGRQTEQPVDPRAQRGAVADHDEQAVGRNPVQPSLDGLGHPLPHDRHLLAAGDPPADVLLGPALLDLGVEQPLPGAAEPFAQGLVLLDR
ncbi:hypothetical protein GCM10027294_52460 [Marinactinospora endophytica]